MQERHLFERPPRGPRARAGRGKAILLAAAVPLMIAGAAFAQAPEPHAAPVIGVGTLPRDLSPWGMYLNADWVVQAVLIGLVVASVVTWTVLLAKSIELMAAGRRVRRAIEALSGARSSAEGAERIIDPGDEVGRFLAAAVAELQLSAGGVDRDGVKERVASRLERIEASYGRRIMRGTGVLATIGATAPFVGLFGTVWGIMNSFGAAPSPPAGIVPKILQ
jgi:biopolymer transport protein ExbB